MLCRDVMNVIEKEYPLNYADYTSSDDLFTNQENS